jgi:type 2 lantibiotic biosynthesis protein LanM
MNQNRFESAAWYRALTLTERLASLRANGDAEPAVPGNAELAEKRLRRWREQNPFPSDAIFAQRLALDGIGENELRTLLGEPIEALRARTTDPLAWLEAIKQAFALPAVDAALPMPETLQGQATIGFLQAIAPLIQRGREQVRAGVQTLVQRQHSLPFDRSTIEDLLFASLPGRLLRMLSRTLVLELNIARLEGQLPGESPEQRFQSFLQRLRDPEIALGLLEQYPVLARQLVAAIETWAGVSLEFLRHLRQDWPAISDRFSPDEDPGSLIKADFGAGDVHKGGRTVVIVTFASGLQLVYKPRPLAVETHFQELLEWLNERGAQPAFRTMSALDRYDHGWVEYISADGCATSDEIARFYRRQGAYLALLYALEATDFHQENLIAAGEHPMLIDLESLFHPRADGIDLSDSENPIDQTMSYSVLRVLLLPVRVFGDDESDGIDISGLGGAGDQLSPKAMPDLEAAGTDEMHFVRRRQHLPGTHNRPNLNGAEVDPLEYTEALVAGFGDMYQLLLRHREALLAEAGPLARFAEDEIRLIVRDTRSYALLLFESFHPHLLRNALDRDRHFDRLWLGVEARPFLTRAISAERNDLLRGDIPMFTTQAGTRDVWSSDGEHIADLLDEAGLELVRRRVRALSEADLAQQTWFIRASMATLAVDTDLAQRPSSPRPSSPRGHPAAAGEGGVISPPLPSQREASEAQRTGWLGDEGLLQARLIAAAHRIGERLEGLAYRGEGSVAWIGLMRTPGERWALQPAGIDLYSGLPGLALFLAYLGDITGEARYTALAMETLQTLRDRIERGRPSVKAIGAFADWGGIIYTFTHLATLWDRPELLAEAEAIVEMLPALIEADKDLDIIGGAAGCIGALLALYRAAPSERTLQAARACGERLLATAQPLPEHGESAGAWRVWWPPFSPRSTVAGSGFSHGAAGFSWALLELAARTGDDRYRQVALRGIIFERSLFSPEAGNWHYMRQLDAAAQTTTDGQAMFVAHWCHGAPGIGLARLLTLPYLDDAAVRSEIDAALHTTIRQGFGVNHSLCHGDLGNLETVLQAVQRLGDPYWRGEIDRLTAQILDDIDQNGWRCGVPLGVETPGLMNGLAGIGYQLLRLAAPERVPSVLALEAPRL